VLFQEELSIYRKGTGRPLRDIIIKLPKITSKYKINMFYKVKYKINSFYKVKYKLNSFYKV